MIRESSQLIEVQPGDSLAKIAYQVYGSESNFRDIADENDIDIFAQGAIRPGVMLAVSALKEQAVSALSSANIVGLENLDLSKIKQSGTENNYQLFNWIV